MDSTRKQKYIIHFLKVLLNKDHLFNYQILTYSLTLIYIMRANHKKPRMVGHCNSSSSQADKRITGAHSSPNLWYLAISMPMRDLVSSQVNSIRGMISKAVQGPHTYKDIYLHKHESSIYMNTHIHIDTDTCNHATKKKSISNLC